ncbi:hypothetical protein ACWD4N_26560, partial [Streptomyces sp. NPDC002586]
SYSTVYAIARALDPALVVLAHEGSKRYREVYDLIHRREAEGPNAIWQADHTQLDLWVIAPSGRPARPWLTVIEDDYSRANRGVRGQPRCSVRAEHRSRTAPGDLAQAGPVLAHLRHPRRLLHRPRQ